MPKTVKFNGQITQTICQRIPDQMDCFGWFVA